MKGGALDAAQLLALADRMIAAADRVDSLARGKEAAWDEMQQKKLQAARELVAPTLNTTPSSSAAVSRDCLTGTRLRTGNDAPALPTELQAGHRTINLSSNLQNNPNSSRSVRSRSRYRVQNHPEQQQQQVRQHYYQQQQLRQQQQQERVIMVTPRAPDLHTGNGQRPTSAPLRSQQRRSQGSITVHAAAAIQDVYRSRMQPSRAQVGEAVGHIDISRESPLQRSCREAQDDQPLCHCPRLWT